jgi:uncharacterized protein DUF3592
MSDSLLMVIAALVCFAVAVICAFASNRRQSRIAASASWPKVGGTVLSNEVKLVGTGNTGEVARNYSVALRYGYTVAGTPYESSRIGWGTKSADRKPDIPQAFVRDYPAGHAIDVFYDPGNPAMAMIDPTGRLGLVHVNLARVMAWTLGFCGLLALGASALS